MTFRKIHFVDKSAKSESILHEKLRMEAMEECVGGALKGPAFSFESYSKLMRAEDEQRLNGIRHFAAQALPAQLGTL